MNAVMLALFSCLLIQSIDGVYYNFYWRPYNNEIPTDAVPGGHDLNFRTTYIGQALVYSDGKYANVPSEIVDGQETNYFPLSGYAIPVTSNIMILCSTAPSKVKWIPTNVDNFYADTMGQYVVPGGSESFTNNSGNYTAYVGRITEGTKIIVGKLVIRKPPNDMTFYYVYKNTEYESTDFEIMALAD